MRSPHSRTAGATAKKEITKSTNAGDTAQQYCQAFKKSLASIGNKINQYLAEPRGMLGTTTEWYRQRLN